VQPGAPIGVYDSGVGGLSVLQALRRRLPQQPFIYVADSGHAPYGGRERDFIEARATHIARFLVGRGARALVLACNTVSVVAARRLRLHFALPIVAMEPPIKPAALATRSKVVLVLATATTVASDAVAQLCRRHAAGVQVMLQACPGLVEAVERGACDDPATAALLQDYLRPGLAAGADVVVLGCTHYPFLAPQIAAIAGPRVALMEPSDAIARRLVQVLHMAPAQHAGTGTPTSYVTSGSPDALRAFLAGIGEPSADVQQLPVLD
jgi:glutamate racemase